MNDCCDMHDRIIDVDCEYENGRFKFLKLPHCIPERFTVRFKAPADFNLGDSIGMKGEDLPVMTSRMEVADTGIFKTGAIMICEIDLDQKLAFIRTGGAMCECEDVEFQTSNLVYYIDPLGDDSPNNPGGIDSPFKTLAGAGRAAWQNTVMNPLGRLVFSFNPGVYELTTAERIFMTEATHPLGLYFQGTTSEKPLLDASDRYLCRGGFRQYENLRLSSRGTSSDQIIAAHYNAVLWLYDVEIIANKPFSSFIHAYAGCSIRSYRTLKLIGNGHSFSYAIGANDSHVNTRDTLITLEGIPAVSTAFMYCDGGYMGVGRGTFAGSTSGKRYHVIANGVIQSNNSGPNFLPGTTAGTAASGGLYL